MRATLRLLANVKPARYLEPFTPTGLTGLTTHPNPRPTLIYLYTATLKKLKDFPESSVYRQSTEALTQQRLNVVKSTKPPGFDEWLARVRAVVEKDPERYQSVLQDDGTYAAFQEAKRVETGEVVSTDQLSSEPEVDMAAVPSTEEELYPRAEAALKALQVDPDRDIDWEPEPALEAVQVSDIENKIGAGLIEEVIQVAEGELTLVDEMARSKVWEELEEKPRPGQWTYFERS